MLKRVIGLLVIFLVGIYYIPIYWEQRSVEPPKTAEVFTQTIRTQNQVLPVRGFEHYIGKPTADFIDRYGLADRVGRNDYGSQWWIYQENEAQYKQIEVRNNHIQSIFVSGEGVNTGPLRVGMTRDNVYDEAELSNHFNFTYQGMNYYLSLSNLEVQQFPIVQFENDSFAVLIFHPESEEIYGIRYLSYESLLSMNFFNIWTEEDEVLDFQIPPLVSEYSEEEKETQLLYFINHMRRQRMLEPLVLSPTLDTLTQELIDERDINDLTFAEDLQEGMIYVSGEHIYDTPMFFSQMLINPVFQKRLYQEDVGYISVKVQDDDALLAIFKDEEFEVFEDDY